MQHYFGESNANLYLVEPPEGDAADYYCCVQANTCEEPCTLQTHI